MKTGLTSVTFRNLDYMQIISLAKECNLDGIEWGSDVHAAVGDMQKAKDIRAKTKDAGLVILSYGSYYRLGEDMHFDEVLDTAVELGAKIIRIWAGNKGSADVGVNNDYYIKLADEAKLMCDKAAKHGITICTEYHRGTLTDTAESALKLLTLCDGKLKTYWQPNPDISQDEKLEEIDVLLPYITQIHVFVWTGANVRFPLSDGEKDWSAYINKLGKERGYILEFVKDDEIEQFKQDAKTLNSWRTK